MTTMMLSLNCVAKSCHTQKAASYCQIETNNVNAVVGSQSLREAVLRRFAESARSRAHANGKKPNVAMRTPETRAVVRCLVVAAMCDAHAARCCATRHCAVRCCAVRCCAARCCNSRCCAGRYCEVRYCVARCCAMRCCVVRCCSVRRCDARCCPV